MNRLLAALVLAFAPVAVPAAEIPGVAAAVAEAIEKKQVAGAVVVVVHKDEVVVRAAFGDRVAGAMREPMTVDTVFDLASLTKPVATASAVMKLVEAGKLSPADRVAKHWPEFAANGKADVTVGQCLLHTSGLTADNAAADYADGPAKALERVAALKLEAPPGTRFRYSDVGFIVLGELVNRLAGTPLPEFVRAEIFAPLKMADTGYNPAAALTPRVAPTETRAGKPIRGEVHDPRAFGMGGAAGHAGLFGTADDLARFARMLLRGGELDGTRVFAADTVKAFTTARPLPGGLRTWGWDCDTGFSGPRGDRFTAGDGFGHTGFTGTSVWFDPPSRTAVVILTSRLHPDGKGNAAPLRRRIGTAVAAAFAGKAVRAGVDVLRDRRFADLAGANVGLITNHTGRAADGTPTIDLLNSAPGVKLVALFSPEHGIRGEKDENVGDGTDAKTGLPVYSLYGTRRKPTAETLKGIDTLVYDIQDVGCRFYTYVSTLGLALETAKEHKLRLVVLDRPNPIGSEVEGPVRDAGKGAFVAWHDVPVRHGMTAGELAGMFDAERKIGANFHVVRAANWERTQLYERTLLPWVNPSPNMRHATAALLYPGVGLWEFTNISVGRGTERPFEWVGAPWIDGRALAAELAAAELPGVAFVPVSRTPASSVHAGKVCSGVNILVTDRAAVKPVRTGLVLAAALRKLYPAEWETKKLDTLLLHAKTADGLLAGTRWHDLEAAWTPALDAFRTRRAKFLLYP